MRRIAGKPEEKRLFGAEFRPFESVRNPFSVAGKFHFAFQLDFAADVAGEVAMVVAGEVAVVKNARWVARGVAAARVMRDRRGGEGQRGKRERRARMGKPKRIDKEEKNE